MEKISLIASIICAFTSLTTALRGLARSREYPDKDIETLQSSARLPRITARQSFSSSHNLFIYRLSTLIWFILAILFAVPTLLRLTDEVNNAGVLIWTISYGLLAILILLIWRWVKI
jgi:hypothetical protein